MTDTSALLGQLKIDRSAAPTPKRSRRRWWAAGAVVLLLLLGYALLRAGGTPTVQTTLVRALPSTGAAASVLDASGYVVARRRATVSSKVTGKVVEVLLEEGKAVSEGDVLARIDDINARAQLMLAQSQLAAARAQLAEVGVQVSETQRQQQRTRELAERKVVSIQALDTAQANYDAQRARLDSVQRNVEVAARGVDVQQRNLEDTVIRAPFDGVITVKNAQPGEMISPLSAGGDGTRTGIGTLVDMDSLEIEVDVNENFINRVHPGQPATARLNAYSDWEIPAEVVAVIPTADRAKATVRVRVAFKLKDPRILPDMGVRVAFRDNTPLGNTAEGPAGVRVAAAAVEMEGDQGVVWVVQDNRLERRAVKVSGKLGEDVRVLSGLRAGDAVAIGDRSGFADGLAVKVKNPTTP